MFTFSLIQGFTLGHFLALLLRTFLVHSPWVHPGHGEWERGWFFPNFCPELLSN